MSDDLTHIKDLVPDPKNRRKHTPRNVGMIVDALHKVGAGRSIVIDENNEVLAGNATIEAAGEAGITQLKVIDATGDEIVAVRRTGLTTDQKRDLAIFDNRTGELADWDADQLLKDVEVGVDLSSFFREDELSSLLDAVTQDAESKPDIVPDRRVTSVVRGDVFLLGRHRLMCGDSTDAQDVSCLMGDCRDVFMFTSPPYLDARDYGGQDLSLDHLVKFFGAYAPHISACALNLGVLRRSGAVVRYWDAYIEAAESAGMILSSWNIWDRGGPYTVAQQTAQFAIEHEFIFVLSHGTPRRLVKTVKNKHPASEGGMSGGAVRNRDGTTHRPAKKPTPDYRRLGTVSHVLPAQAESDTGFDGLDHPARFPVQLVSEYVQAIGLPDLCDPFGGSGTSLIAAENNKVRGLVMEIDPSYCQVTLDRWEAYTGGTAVKVDTAASESSV